MAGQSIWELRNENKKLKERIDELTCELSDKTAEFGHLMLLKDKKIENLRRMNDLSISLNGNLIGTYEKRLGRMAERLTDLAAERNEIYAAYKACSRVVNRLQDEREELINRLEKAEREVFELEEENGRLEHQLEDVHTIKGSRPQERR